MHLTELRILGLIFLSTVQPMEHNLFGDILASWVADAVTKVSRLRMDDPHCVIHLVCQLWQEVIDSAPQAWCMLRFHHKLPGNIDAIKAIFTWSGMC
jgi:hypothetical protein